MRAAPVILMLVLAAVSFAVLGGAEATGAESAAPTATPTERARRQGLAPERAGAPVLEPCRAGGGEPWPG